jgi:malonyl-CoA/methylmalonyl-CoA synthetase
MASVLAARALSPGDRLAIFLPNRIEYIDLFLAATRLGIIVVPINILYREREAGHILRDSEPRALVVSGAAPLESDVPIWQIDELIAEARVSGTKAPVASLDGHTPAALIYTSGTTGAAKGAVITHGSLAANATTLVEAWRITAGDRLLLALPLFHVHGLGNGIHCWLRSGCRLWLLERFDHMSAAATLLDFRPTLFFGVPTMYVRLLEVDEGSAREIGASLRLAVSGSAPLPSQVLLQFDTSTDSGFSSAMA